MNIQPIHGDIVEMAPRGAELAGLWICGGFDEHFHRWRYGFRAKYPALKPLDDGTDLERPWLAAADQVFEIDPPDELLRYIYVFSNPSDVKGLPTLEAVKSAVACCLDRAVKLEVRGVALVHIPFAPEGRTPTFQQDNQSARAILEMLRLWDECFPDRIDEVCLVDSGGRFDDLLPPPL
jgi:hypothetical protein